MYIAKLLIRGHSMLKFEKKYNLAKPLWSREYRLLYIIAFNFLAHYALHIQ